MLALELAVGLLPVLSFSSGRRSRFAERGNPINAANKQDALFIDLRIAQRIGARLTCVFGPDAVELPQGERGDAGRAVHRYGEDHDGDGLPDQGRIFGVVDRAVANAVDPATVMVPGFARASAMSWSNRSGFSNTSLAARS